ncbi:MAG: 2-C-methyl-D-erythritol 2,4-cyclodiphosphate synthase [Candidatus Omnitrophota bacterium]
MQHVGIGYDIHRLVKGRKLILGGVHIPYAKGLLGHSDADVLLHAICDALLGAMGLGDIGEHFPNTDKRYKGISSVVLLSQVKKLVQKKGFKIHNVDSVVIAEKPNLKTFKPKMCSKIAQTLSLAESKINIKATTQEGLGFGGVKEAMAAYAVVIVSR